MSTTPDQLFIGNPIFTVSDAGRFSVLGQAGAQRIRVLQTTAAGSDVSVDQNVETLDLTGTAASYTFQTLGSNQVVISQNGIVVATVAVQGDTDGTVVRFADGSASLRLTGGFGNISLGNVAVNQNASTAITPTEFDTTNGSGAVGPGPGPGGADTVTLTANTDIVTANIFIAPLVFTPGGDDRVNSLQDEDELTARGANPTLNATLGNANDQGGTSITPEINGSLIFNLEFTGNNSGGPQGNAAVNRLDLQDAGAPLAVNINRITDSSNFVVVDNMTGVPATLSLNNTSSPTATVGFNFLPGVAAVGAADMTTLTLNRVTVNGLSVEDSPVGLTGIVPATGTVGLSDGVETLNLVSTGAPNRVGVLSVEDAQTINISGSQNLTLGTIGNTIGAGGLVEAVRRGGGLANVAGSLANVNASTLTGMLDYTINGEINSGKDNTSGVNVDFTATGGINNDTFRLGPGAVVQAGDKIIGGPVGGADTNTLQLLGNNLITPAAGNVANIIRVQNLDIRTGQDAGAGADAATVDGKAFDSLASVTVRNEGQDDLLPIDGIFNSTPEPSVVTINNANAATANGITALHGTTGNNGIANNVINVNSLAGVTTGGLTLGEGINSDPRFNLMANFVGLANINLRDQDTESNTVQLIAVAAHTGNLVITGNTVGGNTGQFLNLDATANAYRYDQTGLANDGGTISTNLAINGQPTNGSRTDVGLGAAERLLFASIDSTAYNGNVVLRVSDSTTGANGGQTIRFGAGNDTVIFDQVGAAAINRFQAGLTINDVAVGGDGSDVLAIDGHGVQISLDVTEFTGVSGFETFRFIGNGFASNNARGGVNAYNLTLNDAVIGANGTVVGGVRRVVIVNDNDATNDAPNVANDTGNLGVAPMIFPATGVESGITIDLTRLNANATSISAIDYRGEEGSSATADRFIFSDAALNGNSIIDGGAGNNNPADTTLNADVLQVSNFAAVTTGDLAGISNINQLEFVNTSAIAQNATVSLDDATVNRLVDAYHTASVAMPETVTIRAINNPNVVGAVTNLTIQAQTLTAQSQVNAFLDRGTHVVNTGAGNDSVVILGNFTAAYAAGIAPADQVQFGENVTAFANGTNALRAITDTIALDGGTDTITYIGFVNTAGATISGVENEIMLSGRIILASQLANLTTLSFNSSFGHELVIVDDVAGNNIIDLSKIRLNGGSLEFNVVDAAGTTLTDGVDFTFQNVVVDASAAGNATRDATLNQANISGAGPINAVTPVNLADSPFTITANNQNLDAGPGALRIIGGTNVNNSTLTGTFNAFGADDVLQIGTGGVASTTNLAGINGGLPLGISTLDLSTNVAANAVTLTTAQLNALASITTNGTDDTITISDVGTVTGNANVRNFVIQGGSTFTVGALAQGVNEVGAGNSTLIFGAGSFTGAFAGSLEATDTLRVINNTDLSGTTGNTAGVLDFQNMATTLTLNGAQNASFTFNNTLAGNQTIVVTTPSTFTAGLGIEQFNLQGTGNMVTITAATPGVNILGVAGMSSTILIGGNTVTGTITLPGAADALMATTGANISAASAGAFLGTETLNLTGNLTLTLAQTSFTTANTGSLADSFTFTDAGTFNAGAGFAGIETFNLANGANIITLTGAASQTVNGGTGADAIQVTGLTSGINLTLNLGADAAADIVSLTNVGAANPLEVNVATVSNFVVANDGIRVIGNGMTTTSQGFQSVAAGLETNILAGANRPIEITGSNIVNLADDADVGTVEQLILGSIANISTGQYAVAVYGGGNAGIYHLTVMTANIPTAAGLSVEHVATLTGVALDSLGSNNFVA